VVSAPVTAFNAEWDASASRFGLYPCSFFVAWLGDLVRIDERLDCLGWFRRRNDGINIINLGKTYEKMLLAARVIVAIENPQDIVVLSARPYGQRAILKFASYTGAKALAGRYTPGLF
jgi:hypothetical protein